MGLSSNARLLSITARLTSNEYESQQISNSKMRLAAQSQEASQNYLAALNEEQLVFMGYTSQGFETTSVLTGALLYEFGDTKNQYGIVNSSGQLLVDHTDAVNFQTSATLDVFLEKNGVGKVWKDKTVQEYYELYTSDEYQGYKKAWENICADVENAKFNVEYTPMYSISGTNTTAEVTTKTLDSDEAWALVYKSSHTQLSELVDLYNESVSSYNKVTGYSIPKYELNYASNKSTSTSYDSVTNITYATDTSNANNLGSFRVGYDANNILAKEDITAQAIQFNANVDALTRADSGNASASSEAQEQAIAFINKIYQQIIKAEQACSQCETKDIWIQNIAKTITPIAYGSRYPEFVYDPSLPGTEEDQREMYEAECDQYPLQNYDRTAGLKDSTAYNNYQKYIELETELSYMLEDYDATIANPSNCYTYSDLSRFKWYTNLWYRMNGQYTRKSNEGINAHYYKELDNNLLYSKSWLQDSLRNGTVTLEVASNMENLTMSDLFDVSYIGHYPNELVLKNIKWDSRIYTSCSDITTVQDKTRVARAEAEYERRTQEISAKDQRYQNTLKKLETEHSALQTEYESVQTALEKNIDRSYKTFNG